MGEANLNILHRIYIPNGTTEANLIAEEILDEARKLDPFCKDTTKTLDSKILALEKDEKGIITDYKARDALFRENPLLDIYEKFCEAETLKNEVIYMKADMKLTGSKPYLDFLEKRKYAQKKIKSLFELIRANKRLDFESKIFAYISEQDDDFITDLPSPVEHKVRKYVDKALSAILDFESDNSLWKKDLVEQNIEKEDMSKKKYDFILIASNSGGKESFWDEIKKFANANCAIVLLGDYLSSRVKVFAREVNAINQINVNAAERDYKADIFLATSFNEFYSEQNIKNRSFLSRQEESFDYHKSMDFRSFKTEDPSCFEEYKQRLKDNILLEGRYFFTSYNLIQFKRDVDDVVSENFSQIWTSLYPTKGGEFINPHVKNLYSIIFRKICEDHNHKCLFTSYNSDEFVCFDKNTQKMSVDSFNDHKFNDIQLEEDKVYIFHAGDAVQPFKEGSVMFIKDSYVHKRTVRQTPPYLLKPFKKGSPVREREWMAELLKIYGIL